MKSKTCLYHFFLGILPLIIFAFVVIPTWTAFSERWMIKSALVNAKSVEVIHYRQGYPKEQIFSIKELKPQDFHKVAEAFPLCLDVGFPSDPYNCAPNPHHRIVITDSAGKKTPIRVCFLCDHFQVGENGAFPVTPYAWRYSLRQFFIEAGFPAPSDH